MKKSKVLTTFVVLVYIFLFAPLVIIAMTSIGTENYIAFPPKGFSLQWFITVFKSESFIKSMGTSFYSIYIISFGYRNAGGLWIK